MESSAREIARKFRDRRGRRHATIESADLRDTYRKLSAVFRPTDPSIAAGLLATASRPDGQDRQPFWGVIVETRKHKALEPVVLSITEVCDIPVQLFHGKANREFIQSTAIGKLIHREQVVLSQLDADRLKPRDYNTLLMSREFWKRMVGRKKILVFQTDSICCSRSAYSLEDFEQFDYIGCNWDRKRPVGLIVDGGNGGFSLRDWSASMECLDRFDPGKWPGGEDGYFAFHMELMGRRVASIEEAGRFGTQRIFRDKSLGCHKIGRLRPRELKAFLDYCPEARQICA